MTSQAGRIVILVPVRNGASCVGECLDALLASDAFASGVAQASVEVLVVDDGSTDASASVVRAAVERSNGRVRLVELGRNGGFAAAVNSGAELALGCPREEDAADVLVLLNQDCMVAPGWLAPLVDALEDGAVAVAGARLLDADGITLQHAGARIEPNGLTTHFGRGSRDAGAWRESSEVDYVCGALVAMRVVTWRRFGPLDERYAPAYFEEVDFCVRARRAGKKTVYVPASEARHFEASSSGGAGSATFLARYHRSRMRFVVQHMLGRGSRLAWLRAEAAWLATLRRRSDIAPVLAAYLQLPSLLREQIGDRSRFPNGASKNADLSPISRNRDLSPISSVLVEKPS